MSIAVVGGSGFVGRHVIQHLLETGSTVINVDVRAPAHPLPGERVVVANLLDPGEAERVTRALGAATPDNGEGGPIDGVVWLAATIRQRKGVDETAQEDLALMVDAPLRFLRAQRTGTAPSAGHAQRTGTAPSAGHAQRTSTAPSAGHSLEPVPPSFVYMSSIQVYGRPSQLPVDEDHPTNPFTAYGAAKLYAEQVLDIAGRQCGTSVASLRAAFIYGPGQHPNNVLPRFLASVRKGEPPVIYGRGADVRDDVYVGDVARAVGLALRHRAHGAFNLASGSPHTLADVARAVCTLGPPGMQPRFEDVPSGWVDRWYLTDRARETFGFAAETPFEKGVRAMWETGDGA